MMIKICGITRREDALEAVEAGASAIGFIFYPKSPRYIRPQEARELGAGIAALKVGVFVDETPASIESVMRSADLDVVQIYGGTAPRGSRVWKAQRVGAGDPVVDAAILTDGHDNVGYDSDGYEAILLDGQSNGVTFDWKIAHNWARSGTRRVIIAGGLDASNVAKAIRIADPWGVDASSGIESSPGIKDHEKMRQFIKAAQGAALSATREAS